MGVAGAAAASLLGNAAGILVVLPYLLSKKRTFRFVLRADDLRETGRELASSCSSFATDKASRIFSGLTVNLLLMYFVGNIGVALYAVYSQLRFILRILAGGALQTISTLGSMLYGERDFYGLRKMLSLLSKYTYALVAALMAGLFCFSAPFLNSYGIAAEPDTVLSLRIMLLSLPFLWLNDLLARLYPSVQRQRLSVLLLTLQNVVLKILLLLLCVAAISRLHWRSVPAVAVWCLLVELLSPAVTLLREKRTCGNVALLGLEDQADRSCHSFSITGKPENVADIHREIDLFCQQNGIPRNKGVLLAIAFEEAALNIINHNEHVSMIDICLLLEEGSLIVRIRDDGAPFDPLAFVDDEDILQMNNIRLLERLTDQKTYTRIMNMNNTVLSIRLEAAENDGANDGTCRKLSGSRGAAAAARRRHAARLSRAAPSPAAAGHSALGGPADRGAGLLHALFRRGDRWGMRGHSPAPPLPVHRQPPSSRVRVHDRAGHDPLRPVAADAGRDRDGRSVSVLCQPEAGQ